MRVKKIAAALAGAVVCCVASMGAVSPSYADGGARSTAGAHAALSSVRSDEIHVALDQAFPIRLGAPASGVAVGNPNIAGVSVQDDTLLFVTGRAYGATNLVIVGEGGRILYSGRIVVSPDEEGAVMVTRGTQVERMQCSPVCRSHVDVGGAGASSN